MKLDQVIVSVLVEDKMALCNALSRQIPLKCAGISCKNCPFIYFDNVREYPHIVEMMYEIRDPTTD